MSNFFEICLVGWDFICNFTFRLEASDFKKSHQKMPLCHCTIALFVLGSVYFYYTSSPQKSHLLPLLGKKP